MTYLKELIMTQRTRAWEKKERLARSYGASPEKLIVLKNEHDAQTFSDEHIKPIPSLLDWLVDRVPSLIRPIEIGTYIGETHKTQLENGKVYLLQKEPNFGISINKIMYSTYFIEKNFSFRAFYPRTGKLRTRLISGEMGFVDYELGPSNNSAWITEDKRTSRVEIKTFVSMYDNQ
jgi:hypothetical protein